DDFTDVYIRFECRVTGRAMGSVHPRCIAQDDGVPAGSAAQINTNPDPGLLTGSLWANGTLVRKAEGPAPPPGEWFSGEVIVVGARTTVKVNGRTTAEYDDPTPKY